MTMGSTLIVGSSQFEGCLFYFSFFLFEYFEMLLGGYLRFKFVELFEF
jgi:hypothetical protein